MKALRLRLFTVFTMYPSLEWAIIWVSFISIYISNFYVVVPLGFIAWVGGWKKSLYLYIPVLIGGVGALFLFYGGKLPQGETAGVCQFHVAEVSRKIGFFGTNYVYSGRMTFLTEGKKYRNLPFKYYHKPKLKLLDTAYDYQVEGVIKKSNSYGYNLKVGPNPTFQELKKTRGWAKKRYNLKKKFKNFLKTKIPSKNAREFLIGISTGDFSNAYLSFTFSRFGLNHLLAISGFHFGLLVLFLNILLRAFLPHKIKSLFLIVATTLFFLFVGNGPSLSRAWIISIVYLLGSLVERPANAINTLSVAALLILTLDPLILTHLGFQFSFLVTYAILMYTSKVRNQLLKILLVKNSIDRHVVMALSLGISVHLVAIPLTLFYFHKFFLMSFFWNLFIPAAVGILAMIFLSAILTYFIVPNLALFLFKIDSYFTDHLLKTLFWVPTSLDYAIRVPVFPSYVLILYLTLFFALGLFEEITQEQELLTDARKT